MAYIDKEDILAYFIEENVLVCEECISDDEEREIGIDEIITAEYIDRMDDRIFFCDRCKKPIR